MISSRVGFRSCFARKALSQVLISALTAASDGGIRSYARCMRPVSIRRMAVGFVYPNPEVKICRGCRGDRPVPQTRRVSARPSARGEIDGGKFGAIRRQDVGCQLASVSSKLWTVRTLRTIVAHREVSACVPQRSKGSRHCLLQCRRWATATNRQMLKC